ncbi:unnamed protein product [Lymnaea stagnalis]|uniref:Uncharacterized protein n=1 Tax=Lymnaea stagnalis TaxID=6523 RepID=A0AAV2HDB9_LYMST
MVDFQSHYRIHPLGFTAHPSRVGVKNLRTLYHEEGKKVFRSRHFRPVHDCRADVMKNHSSNQEFEAWILSHGLQQTYKAVDQLHSKTETSKPESRDPGKLISQIGSQGKADGEFNYPRGICTTMECDILVADSMNHRIQRFNQFGIFVNQVGCLGKGELKFNEPCDVIELPNGDVAVADRKNKSLQVLSEDFVFKYFIPLHEEPLSLGCDRESYIAIATTTKKVIMFDSYEREIRSSFPVGSKKKSKSGGVHVTMSYDSTIIVSDVEDGFIYKYSPKGDCLGYFKPDSQTQGLAVAAGNICLTPLGQILLVDTLNHTVNLYTDSGTFLQQVLKPTDDVGNIYSLALGLEGHLVVAEFSVVGDHCLKIFRYGQCKCHDGKTNSSKRKDTAQALKQAL